MQIFNFVVFDGFLLNIGRLIDICRNEVIYLVARCYSVTWMKGQYIKHGGVAGKKIVGGRYPNYLNVFNLTLQYMQDCSLLAVPRVRTCFRSRTFAVAAPTA